MDQKVTANIFHGWQALSWTLDYFDYHFVIIGAVTLLLVALRTAALLATDDGRAILKDVPRVALICLAHASFGFVTAYFLSQGITDTGIASEVLTAITAPFIALLTAGLTYLSSEPSDLKPVRFTGAACFLLTCVISYQTFAFQKHNLANPSMIESDNAAPN